MRNYYATRDLPQPPSQQEPYPTPYLGLRANLSQTWINRWTILLLLVLVRTLFAVAGLNNDLAQARKEALSMCTSVENVGSAMASMPYYMAQGANELTAQGIEKAINGLMQSLLLMITGVEDIVVFIINFLTQNYICLITFAVTGSLHAGIAIAEDVGGALNATAKGIGDDLGDAASDFEKAMNGFIADIDKIGSFLTGDKLTPPTIDLTSEISKLQSLQLPPGYDSDLQKLNASIPTFAQVHNLTQTAIEFPFEEVKKLLNDALPTYTVDRSIFPVPQKKQLTFCSDNNGITDFFDDLVDIAMLAKKVFLITLIVLAALAMIPMAWKEMRRWRFTKERARLVKSDAFDPLDAVYIASRPYTSTFGLKIADKFKSRRRQNLVRWTVAYATTIPALFVLSLGVAGLLGCACQYILLKLIQKEVPKLENQVIGFADRVINDLNDASEQWADGVNDIITDTSNKINHDVFGWVNTTTSAVNNTLNIFVNETIHVLNETFGGTVLYEPILDVLNCLVLMKVQGIEKGLTWVSDHAHVDLPMLPNNTFSLGTIAKVSGSEADILATGPNGGAADAITAAMFHVINFVQDGIRQEAIISSCVVLIWVIIALVGLFRALVFMLKGGDDDAWEANLKPSEESTPEKRPRNGLLRIPTYKQATHNRDVPTVEIHSATSPIINTGFSPHSEKFGSVNGQVVDAAIRRPVHVRASSHGHYEVTSPEHAFSSNYLQSTQNPFADPVRRGEQS
ncbi:hypothetical protein BDY17DRAFT_257864 [Neohortaea acidophila]|uniref:Plasma membrane fusion protein PRM1 n=1 Tax=Neohortaea acidophila TaxID=245834 RepID=A0A6A6PG95_9PEZI|nr:uncharacterized protein BDY17DRAFT_257864 [Neohortaea acidophila]KAF2478989.1 hypothetical protein BDY17DRAFT_257864 [Neohortaea acidophila]